MISGKNTRTEFECLLQARNDHPDQSAEIDQQIQEIFSHTCAIFVLDMSGFSQLTLRHGILHFLGMIRRMRVISEPIVLQFEGRVIKQEADNLFAMFPDVMSAIAASFSILKDLAAVNTGLPDEQDIYVGIGIGYGEVLVVGDDDLYGSEMNLACKLGEDLARRSEILLTQSAFQEVQHHPGVWEPLDLSISGIALVAHRVRSLLGVSQIA
ncbi:adenylate/guanylate cyclase domain-containing protein [Phormidesmis priestleyi ULC007]|uniref:Adenylate/guanylate cyclase domain-containing protein n=1 Tax=Phormidesmis priestleyi ULC007 TaxID=1920490 RepID=A0A2T1D3C3_9CYAN|nr:adenylate/guanylate cyclase domain-containing protein [Phormidesmis priestleyi]PSB14980.1 adenylate/guanylate cyclase domain-containing protein [Phormidesmis priestleyi ULC007]PZO46373.1 MAG: adenylate/guanylate cyclase domain-containing protein [Phormidesmis priestleyi]